MENVLKYKIFEGEYMSIEKKEISKQLIAIFENIMNLEHQFILKEMERKLSLSEIHTIAAIGGGELCSMSEVAGKLKITVGTLTVAINNLVKKGYVERYKSEQDRRIVKLGLTKIGKEVYRIHKEFHCQLADAITNDFSEKEVHIVNRAITNLENFIEQGYRALEIMDR